MPKKGYLSLTIRTDIYDIAEQDARTEHRSPGNYIQHLILQERELKKRFGKIRQEART